SGSMPRATAGSPTERRPASTSPSRRLGSYATKRAACPSLERSRRVGLVAPGVRLWYKTAAAPARDGVLVSATRCPESGLGTVPGSIPGVDVSTRQATLANG